MSEKLLVRRAAVLGAGVMGAQIAAQLTNAGVDTVLFDLAAKEGDPNGIVTRAIANLGKLSPAPLASKALAEAITPANYETGLALLEGCDLIVEAIAERMDWSGPGGGRPPGLDAGQVAGAGGPPQSAEPALVCRRLRHRHAGRWQRGRLQYPSVGVADLCLVHSPAQRGGGSRGRTRQLAIERR